MVLKWISSVYKLMKNNNETVDVNTLGKHFINNPFLYAGYRAIHALGNNRSISEEDTVPYLRSLFFVPLLLTYILHKRMWYLLKNISIPDSNYDHVISITSTDKYRSYTLIQIAERLSDKNEEVLLLCSPSGEDRLDEWKDVAPVVQHTELHGTIGFSSIACILYKSAVDTLQLRYIIDTGTMKRSWFVFVYNLIFLEYIKHHSIDSITKENPNIHTLKPMPYFIESTTYDNIFVYQHGIQLPDPSQEWPGIDHTATTFDMKSQIPFYVPLTYFVWGEPWKRNFEQVAHSNSTIAVTGSPWFDRLATVKDFKRKKIDVLFISQSHGIQESIEDEYELLVSIIASFCETRDLAFAIKLHPRETRDWYRERGLAKYIQNFDDIDDALTRSKVMVTDSSTAFIEASVIGIPAIVADISDIGLRNLSPVTNISFLDDLEDIESVLSDTLENMNEDHASGGVDLVRIGSSIDHIIDIIQKE